MNFKPDWTALDLLDIAVQSVNGEYDDLRTQYAINTASFALGKVGTLFDVTYMSVADRVYEPGELRWIANHPPSWCGLFALFCCQQNLMLSGHVFRMNVGIRPSLGRRRLHEARLCDIAFFPHHGHMALVVPCPDHELFVLINGNGANNQVSLSTTNPLTLEAVHAQMWSVELE